MKRNLLFLFVTTCLLFSCNSAKEKEAETPKSLGLQQAETYDLKGYRFEDKDLASADELLTAYKAMKVGDTVEIKVKAKVNSVCQKKGCWMRLDLGDAESFVRFQDYGFFMPKDLAGDEVLVNGMAYVEETSVEDLKHYAEDAGKPQEEIDAITEPELSYNFLSTGVLIPKKGK
ncbi:DUF4920 domain-containing protein [Aureisphaera galaxeae]|uniref:DUF4920 domain-containing protein n=1 Tax=Aureisphaera galaxeae TaxID=1538023 RepID=UPI002350E71C|nr:DUF4920 domain-containing protein [Aureisphaera galaxeae]MDC8006232.1 DUF4920 domain-containing protein [Aureisphaera galaxeae]